MIFAFAADTSTPAPPGTAPLAVQARQIPRLLVSCLNDGQDRRVRFFPFMGVVDGARRFFDIERPFDPGHGLEERLIREARRNLVYTNLSVSRIAYALGFEDPAYFTRVFTRATGTAPRAFRQRLAEGD